ncbi:DJ-1/PfpI family protein [bacterium]|nr:DJ-1/PfpI family protein [bacterium]
MRTFPQRLAVLCALLLIHAPLAARADQAPAATSGEASKPAIAPTPEAIAPYQARFGRTRPLVAVIGENSGTEVTDYVVPYGVLTQSGVADVVALATQQGPIQLLPALKIEPQDTIAAFDARYPKGADYVIVPAVHRNDDPALVGWVASQASKGATVIGVCDGVWVVANARLLKERRATGHWFSRADLERKFSETRWQKNLRYVADGTVVTTTGVTASIPASLALVEAIAGRERATKLAKELGEVDWTPAHRSDDFRLSAGHLFTAASNTLAFWAHEEVGLQVGPGTDEIALALVADAYSRTYRSKALAIAQMQGAIRTRRGLSLLPDKVSDASKPSVRMLPSFDAMPAVSALDWALAGIEASYGRATAAFVALQIEYPARPDGNGRAGQ